MRILAIRGCNLTSLEGRFAVEFDREPLRRAGLFAITGPTGAGKSTILDALCLALFDEVPRLPRQRESLPSGPDASPNAVRSTDVRTLLRRGAGFGWAEVDFIGIDGEAYRARWELRRARQKAAGSLQKQDISLTSLDGAQRYGDKKRSVLDEIERRLGLTFEQFRRAVLLAQGDFATFLKAPPRERSALLELLTGTEIYSLISKRTHERALQEEQALKLLEAQCGGIRVLEEEERTALTAEATNAETALREAETRLTAVRAVLSWHQRDEQLAVAERAGTDEAARAEALWRDAEPRRADAALLRRLQSLRPLLDTGDRTAAERTAAATGISRAETTLSERRRAAEQATARHAEARKAFEAATNTQSDLEPALTAATALDGQIAALDIERATAKAALNSAAQRTSTLLNDCSRKENFLAATRSEIAERAGWIGANQGFAAIAEQASRWDAVLSRHADALATLRQAERDAGTQSSTVAALEAEQEELLAARERAGRQAAVAEATQEAILGEQVPDGLALRTRRADLTERRDRLAALTALADTVERTARDREEMERNRTDLLAEAGRAEADALRTAAELAGCQATLAEAEATLRRVQLARREDVATLRGQLAEGEPCPVCGSAEHLWRHGQDPKSGPFARLADEQEERVAAMRRQAAELARSHGGFEAAAKAAQSRGAALTERLTGLAQEAVALAGRWAEQSGALGLPAAPDGEAARNGVEETDRLLRDVQTDEDRLREHRSRLDAAAAAVKSAAAVLAKANEAVEDWTRRITDARHALALAQAARDRAAQDRDDTLAELEAPFAVWNGWRDAVSADPDGFRRTLAARAKGWVEQRDALVRAERQAETLAVALDAAQAAAVAAREGEATAQTRFDDLNRRLSDLTGQRRGMLDGRTVAAVRDELSAGLQRTRALVDQVTVARQEALSRLSAAEQDFLTRQETGRSCEAKAAAAELALAEALRDYELPVEELRRRLATGEAALAAEEAALAEIGTARREAALLAAERTRQRQEHHAAGVPATPAEQAEATATVLTAELDSLRDRLGAARGRLKADAEARERHAAVQVEIAAQQGRYRVWEALRQTIGSADGQKFRNFAQSLSLDALLTHANRYLDELARRYRLERVAGADLEIQVIDREMGDERRGVHSLSGGEMFLVSLALALGLSAMAAGSSGGIGTLFIDEGFGTLDPDSLDVALSCLEALQATGRQVGVISHVPAMVERIGVQIRVAPQGGGRSRVSVLASGTPAAAEEAVET